MQVHSWGRLSAGGSANRHCTTSHDTVGAHCLRQATGMFAGKHVGMFRRAGAAPARPNMGADTRPGLLVDGSQRQQTPGQVARVFLQIRVQGRLSTGGSVGRL